MLKMNKDIKASVLLFGGSFDPPHLGHKAMLQHVLKTIPISKVIILPCNIQPLKVKEFSPAADRLSMCKIQFDTSKFIDKDKTIDTSKLVVANNPLLNIEISVSDYEIKKKGLSYTVDTVKHFKELCPEDKIYVLMGEDSFLDIEKWKSPKDLFTLCSMVVLPRNKTAHKDPGALIEHAKKIKKEYGADMIIMDEFDHPASSTEIRLKLLEGLRSEYLEEYLDKDVLDYISSHNLYKR
jgi:nicotinate-nucleotide adenylyltransferase